MFKKIINLVFLGLDDLKLLDNHNNFEIFIPVIFLFRKFNSENIISIQSIMSVKSFSSHVKYIPITSSESVYIMGPFDRIFKPDSWLLLLQSPQV
jgi:hypothetical protein